MSEQTLEQRRAFAAWEAVSEVAGEGYRHEYQVLAAGAPADIQANGLGQTLAFWYAKSPKEEAHRMLLKHVGGWVLDQMGATKDMEPLDWIRSVSSDDYRRATMEALAYLVWIKRFAEARLSDAQVSTP